MSHTPRTVVSEEINWSAFREHVLAARRILMTAHVRPDGDCIGAEMAMAHAMRTLGKDVRIVNDHPTPPGLQFLDPENRILQLSQLTEEQKRWIDEIDLFWVLDTSSWAQLGGMAEVLKNSRAKKIVLDHHAVGNDLGADMFVQPSAEATGTLCFHALKALNFPLTPETAVPIFTAIAVDTGWFRFSSVRAETYHILGELVQAGVKPDDIFQRLYEQESVGRIRLVGHVLQQLEVYENDRIAVLKIMLDDFKAAGALASDSEDIVNFPLQIAGMKMSVIFVEQGNGELKVSFRSRCHVDCSQVAAFFGGGGHKNAAGATLPPPYEEAKVKVLAKVFEKFSQP